MVGQHLHQQAQSGADPGLSGIRVLVAILVQDEASFAQVFFDVSINFIGRGTCQYRLAQFGFLWLDGDSAERAYQVEIEQRPQQFCLPEDVTHLLRPVRIIGIVNHVGNCRNDLVGQVDSPEVHLIPFQDIGVLGIELEVEQLAQIRRFVVLHVVGVVADTFSENQLAELVVFCLHQAVNRVQADAQIIQFRLIIFHSHTPFWTYVEEIVTRRKAQNGNEQH